MFDFLKKKPAEEDKPTPEKKSWFGRLKQGLTKTRTSLASSLSNLFLGKKVLDQSVLDEMETILLTSDVGIETTQQLIDTLTKKLKRNELSDTEAALNCLRDELKAILQPCESPLDFTDSKKPFVLLVVGVNGAGKTTTIGKLAHHFKAANHSLILAAGDTFRAAAIEQLQVWGTRNQIPVIAQQAGADTAAVIYDAMEAATARQTDLLIADTAGRLHTQANLMAELQKVKRVLAKIDPTAPHETLLVLDATLGQNALQQVKQFHEGVGVTGLALTKLDGTAKGGIIFAIAKQMKLPIRYIGVGESIEDLQPFKAEEFVEALFL